MRRMRRACPSVRLTVCLLPNCRTRFSQKLSNLQLRCLLTTYRKLCNWALKPIIGSLKSKMAEIRHLENSHNVIFSVEGGPIWIKFRRLVQNDMSTAVMWSKSKPGVEFQYGGRLGEINGMSFQSHVPHCRVWEFYPPYWKSLFAIFDFVVLMQFGLWRAAAFVSSPIHLFITPYGNTAHTQSIKIQ